MVECVDGGVEPRPGGAPDAHAAKVDGDRQQDVVRDGSGCLLVDEGEVVGGRWLVGPIVDADRGEEPPVVVGADRVSPLLPRDGRDRGAFSCERA